VQQNSLNEKEIENRNIKMKKKKKKKKITSNRSFFFSLCFVSFLLFRTHLNNQLRVSVQKQVICKLFQHDGLTQYGAIWPIVSIEDVGRFRSQKNQQHQLAVRRNFSTLWPHYGSK
jgi:hypothetical protein